MDAMSDLLSVTTLIKVGAVTVITVVLSILAEVVSPRFAGILTGFPLGAAITLFFMGVEIDPGFAAGSALHTAAGVAATLAFGYCYYRASMPAARLKRRFLHVVLACLAGLAGYFAMAAILSTLTLSLLMALVVPALSIVVFTWLVRNIEDVRIEKRVRMSPKLLVVRSLFAAGTIVLIISTARVVGPTWAGLFSAFPNIMLPLMVIIQLTYSPEYVYVIVKHVPQGLGSVVIYAITVNLCYPLYGVYAGTALAYGAATLYLAATQLGKNLLARTWRGAEQ
ncbi:MAG TPA: hypothetical protein PK250_11560 [Syntrophobacter fumaroxidans]|nr:hypothetical protein [Syntrophobacter fumaroxidans]